MSNPAPKEFVQERFVVGWILACVGGYVVGGVSGILLGEKVGFSLGNLLAAGLAGEPYGLISTIAASLVNATTASAIVGAAQWLALRKHLSHASWWIAAHVAGAICIAPLYNIMGMGVSALLGENPMENSFYFYAILYVLMSPVAGLIRGVWEWAALRRDMHHAAHWIWIRVVTVTCDSVIVMPLWLLGFRLSDIGRYVLDGGAELASGLVSGTITGLALYFLLTSSRRESPSVNQM